MKERKAIVEKKRMVEELTNVGQNYDVWAVIKLRNLPDFILQATRKRLKEMGSYVKVAKLAVIKRVLKNKGLEKEGEALKDPSALVFTPLSPLQLYNVLREERQPVAAKPGQIAPFDIVVPAGKTGIPPGPALTELKQAGLPVQIKEGSIAITKDHVLVKEGEVIEDKHAKVLQKLGILPFEAGVELVFAYDGQYVYTPDVLVWTPDYTKEKMAEEFSKALNLSVNASYPLPQTIGIMLAGAITRAKNLAVNANAITAESLPLLLALAVKQAEAIQQ